MTLTLGIASKPFCMMLCLMMMYHNPKFGNKMFVGLEDIWTNIDILTLYCDLDLDCGNPIFSQNTLAYDAASAHQVW